MPPEFCLKHTIRVNPLYNKKAEIKFDSYDGCGLIVIRFFSFLKSDVGIGVDKVWVIVVKKFDSARGAMMFIIEKTWYIVD